MFLVFGEVQQFSCTRKPVAIHLSWFRVAANAQPSDTFDVHRPFIFDFHFIICGFSSMQATKHRGVATTQYYLEMNVAASGSDKQKLLQTILAAQDKFDVIFHFALLFGIAGRMKFVCCSSNALCTHTQCHGATHNF